MSTVVSTTFSTAEASVRWRVSPWFANEILAGFVEAGLVERVGSDAFVVTDVGRWIGQGLIDFAREMGIEA